jgi:hypothetical protein
MTSPSSGSGACAGLQRAFEHILVHDMIPPILRRDCPRLRRRFAQRQGAAGLQPALVYCPALYILPRSAAQTRVFASSRPLFFSADTLTGRLPSNRVGLMPCSVMTILALSRSEVPIISILGISISGQFLWLTQLRRRAAALFTAPHHAWDTESLVHSKSNS